MEVSLCIETGKYEAGNPIGQNSPFVETSGGIVEKMQLSACSVASLLYQISTWTLGFELRL